MRFFIIRVTFAPPTNNNKMNLDQNLAAHFGVSISAIVIKNEDFGISSLTACVNGVLFDVFFNSKAEITFSCPVH